MRKKQNILMVGSSLRVKGGMTTVVESFLNNKFEDYNLTYVATHIERERILQIIYFSIAIIKVLFFCLFKDISIIHIHFSERGSFYRKYIIFLIGKLLNKNIIVHMHGAEFKEFYENSTLRDKNKIINFLKNSDTVIVLGESWYKYVKFIDKNINVIKLPNSVPCVDDIVERKKNEINILFLAVLIKRKGIFDLINAADIILRSDITNNYDIKFIIAGSGESEQEAKKIVDELDISNNFEFLGWINSNKKKALLTKSQIFVLPSYNEGLPVAILEAMSYGIPIVSTNVGSIEDAVIHNYNGLIHKPGNIEELSQNIMILINDLERWRIFSENNKKLVEEIYSEKKYFEKIKSLYNKLAKGI